MHPSGTASLDARGLRELARAMPKAELHLHLDGSILVGTALELARTRRVDAPRSWAGMRAALVAPERCADQATLLRAFDLPIALLQDAEALERVAGDLVAEKAADGVRYLEIRWAPLLHVAGGLRSREVVAAVARGAGDAAARRGVEARLVVTLMRSHDPDANLAFVRELERHGLPASVVAVDLAGPEAAHPDPLDHADALRAARGLGLHLTLHAGEWGGAEQVRRALGVDPERIAHGPLAIDDPKLVAELAARDVALDLCPTSNVQAGIVAALEAHPLARLHRAGVAVTLGTDDLTVSDLALSDEYARAVERIGLAPAELLAIAIRGFERAFCEPELAARLAADLRAWAAAIPELGA